MVDRRREISRRLDAIEGVVRSESMFAEVDAWWVNGKEIAHFHSEDEIEIRVTKAVIRERRAELKADPRVVLRTGASDWLTVVAKTAADAEFIVELAERAAEAHRPPPGQTAKPPPTGGALARRKRFH